MLTLLPFASLVDDACLACWAANGASKKEPTAGGYKYGDAIISRTSPSNIAVLSAPATSTSALCDDNNPAGEALAARAPAVYARETPQNPRLCRISGAGAVRSLLREASDMGTTSIGRGRRVTRRLWSLRQPEVPTAHFPFAASNTQNSW